MHTFSLRATATLAALLATGGLAQAASTTATGTATAPALTVTSNNGNGGASVTATTTVTVHSARFDSSLGVLTGVSASLAGAELAGGGAAAGVRAGTQQYTLAGQTAALQSLSLPGNTSQAFGPATLGSFADLSAFVGSGTVGGTARYSVTADRTASTGGGATAATVRGVGGTQPLVQTLTYTYLQHANASFDAGSDVNTLSLVATAAGTAFSVNALANTLGAAQTTRLDALNVACLSGCGAFALNLPSFDDLAAGAAVVGTVQLLATAAGSYAGQYLLSFTDDTAVGRGQQLNTLTLDVNATVAAVPEPGTTALLLAGLGVMAFIARRRRG